MHRRDRHRHGWGHRFSHSLGLKMVALFLVLAFALAGSFLFGMRAAFTQSWREMSRPLVQDYADRLVAEIGSPPDVARAQALADRLHLRIGIDGPVVHWVSRGPAPDGLPRGPRWMGTDPEPDELDHPPGLAGPTGRHGWRDGWFLSRPTADGHQVRFGWAERPWRHEPRVAIWITLFALLVLTGVAYAVVRRLLRPLADIHAGAQRFGRGDFGQPIPVRRRDELGRVAAQVNTMAQSIRQMLDAKRGLLLAISHELRSPLTRARLNAELAMPPAGQSVDDDARKAHAALLNDLGEMRDLVTELLESERLADGHAALQPEDVDVASLVQSLDAVVSGQVQAQVQGQGHTPPGGPLIVRLDRTRVRLALRNLLDNALRHSAAALQPPTLTVAVVERDGARRLVFTVRDHGPGVPDDQLPHLTEPFYRADAARQRATGGVGLGLHLCRLVAEAHGGELRLRNAQLGLEAVLDLPLH